MPVPIRCLDEKLCQFVERFRAVFSTPQYQYFVTVLLGLMRMSKGDERCRDDCEKWETVRVWQD